MVTAIDGLAPGVDRSPRYRFLTSASSQMLLFIDVAHVGGVYVCSVVASVMLCEFMYVLILLCEGLCTAFCIKINIYHGVKQYLLKINI